MIGFIDTSLQLQSIMTAHNQWLSKTHSIHCWTTSVFSSTVTSEHWIALNDVCLANDESLATEISWTELTSRQPEYRSLILLSFILSVATKRSSLLPSNGVALPGECVYRNVAWQMTILRHNTLLHVSNLGRWISEIIVKGIKSVQNQLLIYMQ
jgi:hypothetical protein